MQLQRYFRCMDHDILIWLNSDQDYLSGLALFQLHGKNTNLSRILRIGGATSKNRLTLSYELGKFAKNLRVPVIQSNDAPNQNQSQNSKPVDSKPSDSITIDQLRQDQKMIYKMLDNLHAILPFREIKERKNIAFQILDLDDRLKEVSARIKHFEKHGVIPPLVIPALPKTISELDAAELIHRQMTVRTYITRYKKLVADPKSLTTLVRNRELLDKFQLEMDDINKRLAK